MHVNNWVDLFAVVVVMCRVASGFPGICLDEDDKSLVSFDTPCCVDCWDASTEISFVACCEAEICKVSCCDCVRGHEPDGG